MIRHMRNVRRISRDISDAANGAMDAYKDGRVMEAPQITDRILGAIEDRLVWRYFTPELKLLSGGERFSPNIVWKARSLRTSSGIAAEEKRHGANLMGVLDINLPDYRATKGFLAQAKRAEPNQIFTKTNWERLHYQCEIMLSRTPVSFVWIYSKEKGIRVFSAQSILGLKSRNIFDLYNRSVVNFFENHLECFIGDPRLNSTDISTLDALIDLPVERGLEFSARAPE